MQRLLIDQTDITKTQLETLPCADLQDGQARLQIHRFALTANNVTYAAAGFVIGYWTFFPTGIDGQGLVPVWGFGEVVESRADALQVGTRLYGFYPLADELVIDPQAHGDKVVVDAAPHRAGLPPVYNQYIRSAPQAIEPEGLQSLLQPLLATSYLLCDWLQDNAFFDAQQIIIGSASSKTGLGLCKFLAQIPDRPIKIVGLTSPGNRDFVSNLGDCDTVLTYDEIDTLAQEKSVYVDMSGNGDVKTRLHSHLASVLQHSCAVGTSHWDKFQPKIALEGPKPEFFFAPSQIEKRRADWGPGQIERKISAAWKGVAKDASTWLDLNLHNTLEDAARVYDDLANGRARPRDGHVIALS